MLRLVAFEKQAMLDPDRAEAEHCAFNGAGKNALKSGKHQSLNNGNTPATYTNIKADPKARWSLMKSKVDINSTGGTAVTGTQFSPDGVTTRECKNYEMYFSMGSDGEYHLITAYPAP